MSVETLRDRFAMAALTGVWANRSFNDMSPEATARSCYTMADQMLAARGDAAPQPQPTGDAVELLEAAHAIATGYDIDDGSISWRNGQEHAAAKIATRIKVLIRQAAEKEATQ